jgi:hypothetical protein
MSTWTGVNRGGPESLADQACSWSMCTIRIPNRFLDAGVRLCREHALYTWSVVDDQLKAGQPLEQPDDEVAEPYQYPPRRSFIYYIRTGGRIKIGHTTNLSRRLSQYPPDVEILYLQNGDKTLERTEHQRFRCYLADGREWFQDRPEVTHPIAEMAAQNPLWKAEFREEWWRRRKATQTRQKATDRKTDQNVAR